MLNLVSQVVIRLSYNLKTSQANEASGTSTPQPYTGCLDPHVPHLDVVQKAEGGLVVGVDQGSSRRKFLETSQPEPRDPYRPRLQLSRDDGQIGSRHWQHLVVIRGAAAFIRPVAVLGIRVYNALHDVSPLRELFRVPVVIVPVNRGDRSARISKKNKGLRN